MSYEVLKSKSIAVIIPDSDFGGEEKRTLFFVNNYVRYFKQVYLFAPPGQQSQFLDEKVKHIQIKIRGYKNLFKIVSLVKKHNIDFVQGHKRTTFPYLFLLERLTEAKVNFNFDNIYIDKAYLYSLAPKRLYYLSDHMKEHYQKWFKGKENITINMGGEFYKPLPIEEVGKLRQEMGLIGKFILISLGRLSDQKNQELLIKAMNAIDDMSIVCLMVGEGPKESILKSMVSQYNLEDRILFLGHRRDVDKLLSVAHVLVQSSIFEGFPNVFIETVSLAKPIITTKVGSYKTLVGNNGIVVDVNDVDGFAEAIRRMKADYQTFAEQAVELSKSDFFQQFHKSKMLENYLKNYTNDVLNRNKA